MYFDEISMMRLQLGRWTNPVTNSADHHLRMRQITCKRRNPLKTTHFMLTRWRDFWSHKRHGKLDTRTTRT